MNTQQSTVEEREKEINKMVEDFRIDHLVMNTTNQILEPFDLKPKQRQKENDRVDSILKDMFQLVEQKAMEDERERIIDIINNITSLYVSLPTEKVEEMIYKDDIINKITNSNI